MASDEHELWNKIRALPPDKVAEVEDFVDFLTRRGDNRELTRAAMGLSEDVLRRVWDNPEDAAYDQL